MTTLAVEERRAVAGVALMTRAEALEVVEQIKRSAAALREQLLDLHDREGWRALGYHTWEACIQSEFNESRAHLYRLLAAAQLERDMGSPIGDIPESQLREALKLESRNDQREALERADERAASNERRRTAADVKQAADELAAFRDAQRRYAALGWRLERHGLWYRLQGPTLDEPVIAVELAGLLERLEQIEAELAPSCARCGRSSTVAGPLMAYGAGILPGYDERDVEICEPCVAALWAQPAPAAEAEVQPLDPPAPILEVEDVELFAIAEKTSSISDGWLDRGKMRRPFVYADKLWISVGGSYGGMYSTHDTCECVRVVVEGTPYTPGVPCRLFRPGAYTHVRAGAGGKSYVLTGQFLIIRRPNVNYNPSAPTGELHRQSNEQRAAAAAQQSALASPRCEECGAPAAAKRTIGGLLEWRCAACEAAAQAAELDDLRAAAQPDPRLTALCEQAEELGAQVEYLQTSDPSTVRVTPPAGYQRRPLICDADDLERRVKAWGANAEQQAAPRDLPAWIEARLRFDHALADDDRAGAVKHGAAMLVGLMGDSARLALEQAERGAMLLEAEGLASLASLLRQLAPRGA